MQQTTQDYMPCGWAILALVSFAIAVVGCTLAVGARLDVASHNSRLQLLEGVSVGMSRDAVTDRLGGGKHVGPDRAADLLADPETFAYLLYSSVAGSSADVLVVLDEDTDTVVSIVYLHTTLAAE